MIYFLKRANGDIKIGKTCPTNFKNRMWELRSRYVGAELLGVIEGEIKDEVALHSRFYRARINHRREWFRPVPELLEFIAQNTHMYPTKPTRPPAHTLTARKER